MLRKTTKILTTSLWLGLDCLAAASLSTCSLSLARSSSSCFLTLRVSNPLSLSPRTSSEAKPLLEMGENAHEKDFVRVLLTSDFLKDANIMKQIEKQILSSRKLCEILI